MVQITGCEPEMSRELIEELERERRRNFIDRLKHVDWEVEQILKDHRKWFEIQAEWSKKYYEALYRQMDKKITGNGLKFKLSGQRNTMKPYTGKWTKIQN